MSWILLSFGAVIVFTALNLLQRVIAVESENPQAMAVLFNSIAVSLALLVFFATGTYKNLTLPTGSNAWLTVILASLFYGLFERGRFYASKLLDASIFTTIGNITVLVAVVGSFFLYSEELTTGKIIGGTLIIASLLIVSINTDKESKKSISSKGIILGVLVSVSLGLATMLDKAGALYFKPNVYNIFVWSLPLIVIVFPTVNIKDIITEFKRVTWRVFVLAALNVSGYLIQLKALEIADATKVILVIQTTVLLTVVSGIAFLNEKEHMYKKLTAGLIAVAGTYFLI